MSAITHYGTPGSFDNQPEEKRLSTAAGIFVFVLGTAIVLGGAGSVVYLIFW
jgi:hypothetical protein